MGTAFIDLSGCCATQTMVADPVAMDSPLRVIVHVYFMLRFEMLTIRTWMSISSSKRSGRWYSTLAATRGKPTPASRFAILSPLCLLYTSDAADERSSVDLGGRRIIK